MKKNYKELLENLIKWLENYKKETNCKGVVLGISGGKDSTVVAMLAKKVWGDNVLGVLMPNGKQADLDDSSNIVFFLDIRHKVENIEPIYNSLLSVLSSNTYITEQSKTNIPPRIRAMVEYAIAQSLGYRVIGTGNASEYYVGWTTKWGDSAYDFNPIKNLTCTDVVEIGKLLCEEFGLPVSYVEKVPSDGLCGKTDEESFGFSYKDLDRVIDGEQIEDLETLSKIEKRHKESEHKRNAPPAFLD